MAIAAIGVLCFAAGLGNEFIGDDLAIFGQRLSAPRWHDFPNYFRQSYWDNLHLAGLYRPVGLSLLALQRRIFGDWTVGYHIVSLCTHVACSLLVLRLLLHLMGKRTAWVAAALFACHPIHAEAVLPVYGQLDLFATAFVLLAINGYVVDTQSVWCVPRRLALVVLFALGLGCKESAAVLPPIAMLVRGLYLCRQQPGRRRWLGGDDWLLWGTLAVFLCMRWRVIGTVVLPPQAEVALGYPFALRLKLVLVGLAHAIRLSIIPWGQTIHYGHLRDVVFGYPVNEGLWILSALAAVIWAWTKVDRRVLVFGGGWFLIGLSPVLNIIPIGAVVAERFFYLPSVGVVAFLGHIVDQAWQVAGPKRMVATATLVVVLCMGFLLSVRVCHQWRSRESLWCSTIRDHPRSPQAHTALGLVLLDRYKQRPDQIELLSQAQAAFRACLDLNPRSPRALHGLGLIEIAQDNYTQAARYLCQATVLRPHDPAIVRHLDLCHQVIGYPSSANRDKNAGY